MATLRGNLVKWGLLIIFIASAFYIFLFIRHGSYKLESEKINSLKTVMTMQQQTIIRWFYLHIVDVRMLSRLDSVRSLDEARMREDFQVFLQTQTDYSDLVFVNDQGIIELDTSGTASADLKDSEYLRQALRGNDYISDVISDEKSRKTFFIVSSPVYDYEMQIRGAVYATVGVDHLLEFMQTYQINEPSARTYLVNGYGQILTSQGFQNNQLLNWPENENDMSDAFQKSENNFFYMTDRGNDIITFCRLLEGKNWVIVGKINKDEFLKTLNQSVTEALLGLVVLVFFAVISMVIMSNRISRPVELLETVARKICGGDYNYQVDLKQFKKAPSEIQLFSNTFFEMRKLLAERAELWAKYRLLVEDTQNVILFVNCENGKIIEANKAAELVYGYSNSELMNLHYQALFVSEMPLCKEPKNSYEAWHKNKAGWIFPVEIRLQAADINGVPVCMNIISDITERKRYEQKLLDLSYFDELTGVYNRNFFEEKLLDLKKQPHSRLGIIVSDLNELKSINDSMGHLCGDELIITAAKILKQSVRDNDLIARIGGDEFAVILHDVDEQACRNVIARIRESCERHNRLTTYLPVSMSLGYAVSTGGKENVQDLFCRADFNMYQEKKEFKSEK